jgi:hypothetical protein
VSAGKGAARADKKKVAKPLVRDGDGIPRLAVHMGQRQAIGIDDAIAARDGLKSPWSRETALRHRESIRPAGVAGLSGDMAPGDSRKAVERAGGVPRGDCLPHQRFARPAPSLSQEFSERMELDRLMSVEIASGVPAVDIVRKG